MEGVPWLIANLLYGAGLRLTEGLRFRVKDIDFTANQIVVREGKGEKIGSPCSRSVVKEPLTAHLVQVRALHQRTCTWIRSELSFPDALDRKYRNAATEWGWQWVFPASQISMTPLREAATSSSARVRAAESLREAARQKSGLIKPAQFTHFAPFLRHAFVGRRATTFARFRSYLDIETSARR